VGAQLVIGISLAINSKAEEQGHCEHVL
jgi:hypothetical protein